MHGFCEERKSAFKQDIFSGILELFTAKVNTILEQLKQNWFIILIELAGSLPNKNEIYIEKHSFLDRKQEI